ncbi:tetratricopeptide repeat-containing sensor histidine kinase [Flavobacterium sp.]|uniref:ATP-binding protein n=1 Tax=Flavobacterium sp. TaxID=239 RepID=UPI00262D7C8D|nr:tetratricopeptide repeat-containing sensor histidine kinase [Flavobacterium sp.]
MIAETNKDSTAIYMRKAENIKVPYGLRVKYTRKAVGCLNLQKNDSANTDKLIRMARNFYLLNSWGDLKVTSRIVFKKARLQKNEYFIGQSYRWLGIYYKTISHNDSAFYYLLKAEKFFLNKKDEKLLASLYLDKSTIQINVFDIFGAERSAIKSLIYSKRINDKLGVYDALINLGIAFNASEDYKKSNFYIFKAIRLISENNLEGQFFLKEICLNNLGNNYLYLKDYKKASKTFKKALLNKKLRKHNPKLYSTIVDNFAYVEFKLNNNNKGSLSLFLEALKIKDSLRLNAEIIYCKNHLSEYFFSKKDTLLSFKYANEALKLARKKGNYNDLLPSLKQISIVDFKNYSSYSSEYIKIFDSLYRKQSIAKNKFAAIAYETEEITTEKDQAIKQKWIFLSIAVLLFLIGILLFMVIHQRTKQKEMRLLQDQQKANEEIYQLLQNQQNKMDEGRQLEKKRIAQDLHDGIMNRLTSTRLNLHVIAENSETETIKKCLPFIDGIQEIEKEIRNIAHDLNSNVFTNKTSFIGIVESFIEEQKSISSSNYHLEIDASINWEQLAGFKKIHLFRILQEAIQNIEKHARAKNIIVSILKKERHLLVEIFDDGNGFSSKNKKKGIGLQNIYSRAKSCKGSAEIKSRLNEGTTVIVRIPI